ncbi:hypothetical protein AHAS_Ahas09G0076100 [Arachis hypogaea]
MMVGFEVKDIYNAIEKQRRAGASDTDNALNVFRDVMAFDATYGRNKYKCPLVIFSGVDHHLRTVMFGCTILSKEGEESYVWLLRTFLEAMKGKAPKSVITDGDQATKSAIKAIFPEVHHRLYSWHLLRNANARVVEEFGFQQNSWVKDMYEKKHMWSNAYIRGKFFAGLKITSRRVVVANYKCAYGNPVVKTRLEELERFVATVYTRGRSWNIYWGEMDDEFRCSCLRIESFGIPCMHIVGVLVRLNMVVIPDSLILGHWTKKAKQSLINNHIFSGEISNVAYMSMHAAMLDDCRELVKLSCSYFEDYFKVKTKIANEREALREKIWKRLATTAKGKDDDASIHDPPRARHKGCGYHVVTARGRYWCVQRCRNCDKAGHNTCRFIDGNGDDTTDELHAGADFITTN